DDRRRHRPASARVAQRHHGGQEEAARGEARGAGHSGAGGGEHGLAAGADGWTHRRRGGRRGCRAGATAPYRSEGALMANTFAYAEARGGQLRKVALEAVTAARQASDASGGGEVHALLTGAAGIAAKAAELGRYGADLVTVVEHAGLERYNPEAAAAIAAERVRSGGYRAAFFSASAEGRDLAPRVAARLGVSLASDVTGFE